MDNVEYDIWKQKKDKKIHNMFKQKSNAYIKAEQGVEEDEQDYDYNGKEW